MLAGFIGTMVVVTVTISTATFLRNKRSNRVLPHRRVRRRPQKPSQGWSTWTLPRHPFGRGGRGDPADKFSVSQEEEGGVETAKVKVEVVENINYNNNVTGGVAGPVGLGAVGLGPFRPHPPPPRAPALPPPASQYQGARPQVHWAVPTVSGGVAVVTTKARRKQTSKEDLMNKALVSELKMRLEQKRLQNQY